MSDSKPYITYTDGGGVKYNESNVTNADTWTQWAPALRKEWSRHVDSRKLGFVPVSFDTLREHVRHDNSWGTVIDDDDVSTTLRALLSRMTMADFKDILERDIKEIEGLESILGL